MPERHYIVFHRDAAWQFTCQGRITAPFNSREEAIAAAIEAARQTDERGIKVIVQDLDMREETVWPGDN